MTEDRRARRREQTRAKLVAATKTLIAQQGVDNTRIQEITDEADVGFGSFYNHFASKEAIVEAVLADTIAAQGAEVDAMTASLEDPAEVIAVAHRTFVRRARTDPDWAALLVRLELSHDVLRQALGPLAARDIARGTAAGRLVVADPGTVLLQMGGALVAVMRAVMDGIAAEDADVFHAEGIMRMCGLKPEDAAEVARRPLPEPPAPAADDA